MAETLYSIQLLGDLTFAPSGATADFIGVTVIGLSGTSAASFYYQNYINTTLPAGNTSFYVNSASITLPYNAGNTIIGEITGIHITTGTNNTGYGLGSLQSVTTGSGNTVTAFAFQSGTGSNNTIVGTQSADTITTGNGNTMASYATGVVTTTGSNNAYLGYKAAYLGTNVSGNLITCMGYGTTVLSTAVTQLTVVGEGVTNPFTTSNTVVLGVGNVTVVNVGNALYINTVQLTDNKGHITSGTTAPMPTSGTGAGTGPALSVAAGSTDISGIIVLTTGTGPVASATIATVTFSSTWGSSPRVALTPANAVTAALAASAIPFVSSTNTSSFVVTSNGTPLTASTAYQWYYFALS
jgi:trimeric autotransporter adhesin